jgi:hypothetical protein
LTDLPTNLASALRRPALFADWLLAERFFPHRLVVTFPHAWVALALAVSVGPGELSGNYAFRLMVLLVLISFAVGAVVSTKPLLFLGEPERYPEHTALFQVILCVALLARADCTAFTILLAAYSVLAYALSARSYVRNFREWEAIGDHVRQAISAIDRPKHTVMAAGGLFWAILYYSRNLQLYFHGGNLDGGAIDVHKWQAAFAHFPCPGLKLAELREQLGVDYVMGSRAELSRYCRLTGEPESCLSRHVAASGDVLVLSTHPPGQ